MEFPSLISLCLGILLLLLGRKVIWLFAGVVVFVLSMTLISRFVDLHTTTLFYLALALGACTAVATLVAQKILVRLAGFLAGGYLFLSLAQQYSLPDALPWWLPFVAGGVLGAVLLSLAVEWALIILSSLSGAFLIVQQLHANTGPSTALVVALSLVGILIQARGRREGKKKREE